MDKLPLPRVCTVDNVANILDSFVYKRILSLFFKENEEVNKHQGSTFEEHSFD